MTIRVKASQPIPENMRMAPDAEINVRNPAVKDEEGNQVGTVLDATVGEGGKSIDYVLELEGGHVMDLYPHFASYSIEEDD